ncbi:ferric reductase-like transmembrane domain-containing protein [Aspergillus clavatus NRRL 1]|uniref:Rerric reductase like transmembrane component, putative n=1 Tax=Aspergillus clavatus (strain ATCC 1007 / CBS 513.65 / DSM 816 / NCTC 3887 / NRRL 1 / QM 1276 / 107) TaxID=344612 RepID=A1CRA6_ASPCL|nr:rerric reductase like transmembrane component, putative [Aspergillus clavatus NRRL 1]EAW08177.1 rerric reductase like transmembrane component, putative [Aspergillus clavatus NRRL 1]
MPRTDSELKKQKESRQRQDSNLCGRSQPVLLVDYLHLTKALGHVALSQLPFQVLVSPARYISTLRPSSPSVISVLTYTPQSTLTSFHRLFGRLVISPLLLAHAALYLSFFIQSTHPDFRSLLAKRIRDLDVQWGVFGILMAIIIVLFTRPTGSSPGLWVRKATSVQSKRRVFYLVHVSLVAVLCLAAYNHVVHAQLFVIETLGASMVNAACCWMLS